MSRQNTTDWLTKYMLYTDNTEPPELYRLWCGISAIAGALQRKVWLEWDSPIFPNMYIVLVGKGGRTRKGTAMSLIEKFLTKAMIPKASDSITREALIRLMAETRLDFHHPISGAPIRHSSLTVFSPELTVFLGYNNPAFLQALADWFDCRDKWVYHTKGSGTDEVHGVFLNLLGATTPELIRTALPLDAIGGGLASRMVFVFEDRKGKTVAFPIRTQEEEELEKELLDDYNRIHLMKGQFKFEKAFLEAYQEWYSTCEEIFLADDPAFASYVSRRSLHLRKLCMIFSAARDNSMVITMEDFQNAVDILERTEAKMPRVFGGMGQNRMANTIYDILADLSIKKELTSQEIMRKYFRDITSEELESVVASITQMGCGKREYITGGYKITIHDKNALNALMGQVKRKM